MFLDEYLFRTKQKQSEFARKVGMNAQYLSHIVAGRYVPSIKMAKKIEKGTSGIVEWIDIIDFCIEKQKEKKKDTQSL